MKILSYHVIVGDGKGSIRSENEFTITEHNVIAENDVNLVIDDLHFTTIHKTKDKYRTSLGEPSIHIATNDSLWGSRISYYLYTVHPVRASDIKKQIEKRIQEKLGFFLQGVDLSFIKEKSVARG